MGEDTTTVRLGFWNTWLLAPRLWRRGPRLGGPLTKTFAPDVDARAPLVGQALADKIDVLALGEVFEASEQAAVGAAWPGAEVVTGPRRRGLRFQGSGLLTLANTATTTVIGTAQHAYRSGGDLRDSDTFATKGALLTRVRVDGCPVPIEVVSTHLIAGGDLFPIPGADDQRRHHAARLAQAAELVTFVQTEHQRDAVLLLVGDFNVMATNPELADPAADLRDLSEVLAPLRVTDLWADHGVGPGHTCTFTDPAELTPDPEDPDLVLDTPDAPDTAAKGRAERIDYLWLAEPPAGVRVHPQRPRRWAFTGRGPTGGPAGSLSDHLALTVALRIEN